MDPGNGTNALHVGSTLMTLCGGLALFLFGMEQMTSALKMVSGERMRNLLARLTRNRFKAVFAGAFVTAIIQSSSVTTVLVVGFISAGLLSLQQSVGVIFGANIGTTVTAQIVAFKVTHYALALVAVGFGLVFFVKVERARQYGTMVMGLGLIFFGMQLMGDATNPLRAYPPFFDLMRGMGNPALAILLSAVFTGLVQSSSATTGITIVLASQGLITLETGIALILGANIGTCVTAMLAAIRKPTEAVQAAVVHVLFNALGVMIWLGFIDELATCVRWLSPAAPGLADAGKLAAETPRQIANAHTLFNIANMLLFLPFTAPLARLVQKLVPGRPDEAPATVQPKYLDDNLLETSELALDRVKMELRRLGALATSMLRKSLDTVLHGNDADLAALAEMDNDVDSLHAGVVAYLGRLSLRNLTTAQSERLYDSIAAANYIENVADMIETNLAEAGAERLKTGLQVSEGTEEALTRLHDRICWTVRRALSAHAAWDRAMAEEVIAAKDEINDLAAEADGHLARRLVADEPNRLAAFRIESDLIENLRRVYYFAKRIAKLTTDGTAPPEAPDWAATSEDGLVH